MADDLFQRVDRLLKLVVGRAGTEQPLPYGDDLTADLTAALEAAKQEAEALGATTSEEADLRGSARDAAQTFHNDLIALRRTLRAHVGRSHPEYQKLRVARVRSTDADDDDTAAELLEAFGTTPAGADEADAVAEEAAEEAAGEANSSDARAPAA